jgi:DNA-binding NtrC family response regulator
VAAAPGAPPSDGQTVLVVDDEPEITHVLKEQLERALGVQVVEAHSGEEGLRVLRERRVDLIVTDQTMPVMLGTEFLAEAMRLAPDVPRTMLTARQEVALAIDALNALHIVGFYPKPIEMPRLLRSVGEILEKRRAAGLRRAAFEHASRAAARTPPPREGADDNPDAPGHG